MNVSVLKWSMVQSGQTQVCFGPDHDPIAGDYRSHACHVHFGAHYLYIAFITLFVKVDCEIKLDT